MECNNCYDVWKAGRKGRTWLLWLLCSVGEKTGGRGSGKSSFCLECAVTVKPELKRASPYTDLSSFPAMYLSCSVRNALREYSVLLQRAMCCASLAKESTISIHLCSELQSLAVPCTARDCWEVELKFL